MPKISSTFIKALRSFLFLKTKNVSQKQVFIKTNNDDNDNNNNENNNNDNNQFFILLSLFLIKV